MSQIVNVRLAIIDNFKEHDTRDELGIGSVRDGFADLLFPGTSTIQTRARYFLFVPWIYSQLEKDKVDSDHFEDIKVLLKTEDTQGVIGKLAGQDLKRLPSNIYWNGLERWGIRRCAGNQYQYYQSLKAFYLSQKNKSMKNDDGENVEGAVTRNWHKGLPPVPAGFPKEARLALTAPEAQYLLRAGRALP